MIRDFAPTRIQRIKSLVRDKYTIVIDSIAALL